MAESRGAIGAGDEMSEVVIAIGAVVFMALAGRTLAFGPLTPVECQKLMLLERIEAREHNRKPRKLQVFIDGENISKRCYYADDLSGVADCFPISGGLRSDGVQETERLYGNVQMRWIKQNEDNERN